MELSNQIALSLGAGWASGVNLYAAVFMLGLLGVTGNIDLPSEMALVEHPAVLFAAGAMFFIEFFADKIPGVDSLWDAVHTFIRIPAGAVLAASALGPVSPEVQVAAGLVGGTLAAGAHATKAGSRLLINTSPEPFSNIAASVTEDAMVIGGIWAALHHPMLFLALLALFVVTCLLLLPFLWRTLKAIAGRIRALFVGRKPVPS